MLAIISRARNALFCALLAFSLCASGASAEVTTYEYDALGRVVSAIDASGPAVVYSYDAVNNRTQVTNGSAFADLIPASFTASSNAGTSGLTTAGGMRDSNYTASTSIHITNSEVQPWISANFASTTYVDHACVAPASSGAIGVANTNGAVVEYSTDNGASWRNASSISTATAGVCGAISLRVSLTNVRLRLPGSGQLAAGDFRFFSAPGGSTTPPTVSNKSVSVAFQTATSIDLSSNITGIWTSISTGTAAHGTVSTPSGATVTYTPATGYTGADSFTFSATGPGGTSNTATVSVTVQAPVAPTANSFSVTVPFQTATSINLGANVTGSWTAVSAGAASHGTVSAPSGGNVTYTPATGYSGPDSFTFNATGAGGTSNTATVSITVSAQTPPPPTVSNKSLTVDPGSSGSVDVTPSGSWTSVQVASAPSQGTASITGTTATYTPNAGVSNTTDSFTYTATGPGGTSTPATVSVTINPASSTLTANVDSTTYNRFEINSSWGPSNPVPYVTASATGGSGSYSYSWVQVSGAGGFVLDPVSAAATGWKMIGGLLPAEYVSTWHCIVTDTVSGQTATTPDVIVDIQIQVIQ